MDAAPGLDELFAALDSDGDGRLSRQDLRQSALGMGWHWRQAPLYAVLDYLTIRDPLVRAAFRGVMSVESAVEQMLDAGVQVVATRRRASF